MRFVSNSRFLVVALALFISVPAAWAQDSLSERAMSRESFYYLFQGESLGFPNGPVEARFELRKAGVILGQERLSLRLDSEQQMLVPIPVSLGGLNRAADLELWVFAGDRLLDVLDAEALRATNRVLGYTHETLAAVPLSKIYCQSPCGGGCGPWDDYDCDGVNNVNDNCTDHSNSNQADCDNDGYGDVCDATDGIFQASGPVDTCMTDKDDHVAYKTFEHHVEQRLVDVSSCNAPDRWNRWVRMDNDCWNISDYDCCYGLRTSLQAVGDTYQTWCASGTRNVDFCH